MQWGYLLTCKRLLILLTIKYCYKKWKDMMSEGPKTAG